MAVQLKALAPILHAVPLNLREWEVALALASGPALIELLVKRRRSSGADDLETGVAEISA